ncbi:L,D-transpeptidase [Corynebacterium glyciniphilum]|uniref:L,D-transpeptidase n=1 Tax=Corynebacterium glyciniphilum TaxID=1404244 RepID=UPI00265207C6|nr:L,D-transpeptidase [Corynebacterium glyciniphilum]MDN5684594.1 L,D-transpeptidase [Corynebacterium glyciniphilum]
MKSIGRILTLFAGSAALALTFASPANAAPTLNLPEVPGSDVSLPDMPNLQDLPDWADDLLPDGLAPSPGQTPGQPSSTPQPWNAPCAVEAKACISLGNQTAWLQDGAGTITRGPVPASTGRAGYETPAGTTKVTRKDADWWSSAYDAPMPFSVFFSAGTSYPNDIGIAFHEGDPGVLSHGCIHLLHDDAVAFFNTLQVGDVVDVVA